MIKAIHIPNCKKKYLNRELKTVHIEKSEGYENHFHNWKNLTPEEGNKKVQDDSKILHPVYDDNREAFTKLFGKHDFTTGRALEFNYKCWILQYEGFQFIVSTADVKGTNIERISDVNLERKDYNSIVLPFLTELAKLIINVNPSAGY